MTTEAEMELNQHFSVPPSAEQLAIQTAKDLLRAAKPYVEKATRERDYEAFALIPRIDSFLKDA